MNTRSGSSTIGIETIVDQCVKCGLCLPHCPTYRLTGNEMESPRGRLALMDWQADAARSEASTHASATRANALAHCLACGQCERHCPIQVPYLQALQQTRMRTSIRSRWLQRLLAKPQILNALTRVAHWLPRFIRQSLPHARAWLARNPQSQLQQRESINVRGQTIDVAIISGCTGQAFDATALEALLVFAQALKLRAQILPSQCCGSLHAHLGAVQRARKLAEQLQQAVEATRARQIVHLNSGCDTQIRHALTNRSVSTSTAVEWLATHADALRFRAFDQTIAIHQPCTASNAARSALERLLRQVPGLRWRPLLNHAGCCGAAGDQFLHDPRRAEQFANQWRQDWSNGRETVVLSSNIGCSMHLSNQPGISATMQHPVVFLASLLEQSP